MKNYCERDRANEDRMVLELGKEMKNGRNERVREFDKQMEMVLYHSDEGDVCVDAYIMDESLWITQKAMAELFGVQVPGRKNIGKHKSIIFLLAKNCKKI